MRKCFISILLIALPLAACTGNQLSQSPSIQPQVPTANSLAIPTTEYPSAPTPLLTSTSLVPTATAMVSSTSKIARFKGHALIAYESSGLTNKHLVLTDPSDGTSEEFSFPEGAIFANHFLDGLSPDARYFIYYEGGRVEMYDQLVAEAPDFVMRVLDLDSREVIFSTPLLSLEYPQNLKPIVEMTTDEYWREETDHQVMLENLYSNMQQTMMNYMRTVS